MTVSSSCFARRRVRTPARVRALGALVAIASTTLVTGVARAAPRSDAERREAYEQGVAAMKSRDWERAARLFEGLWAEQKTYDVALMLGQIETNLERFRDAAEHLDYGIRNAVPREKLEMLARSRKLLELVKSRIATFEIRVDREGADVEIDGHPVGRAPLDHDVYAEPGSRLVEATSPDAVVRDTVDVRAGERRVVVLEFPEPSLESASEDESEPIELDEAESAPPRERPPSVVRWERDADGSPATGATWPIATGIAAGVAALTGGAFLLMAAGKANEREALAAPLSGDNPCGYGQNDSATLRACERIGELSERRATFRTIGAASLGVSVAFAAVTTYLLWPRAEEPRGVSLSLFPSAGPAGVSVHTGLSGRFR